MMQSIGTACLRHQTHGAETNVHKNEAYEIYKMRTPRHLLLLGLRTSALELSRRCSACELPLAIADIALRFTENFMGSSTIVSLS
jgi:hypothetical protein